jgi:hypothetical protein
MRSDSVRPTLEGESMDTPVERNASIEHEIIVKRIFIVAELLAKSGGARHILEKSARKSDENHTHEILRYRDMRDDEHNNSRKDHENSTAETSDP